jgi:hypothetical protein
MRIRIVLVALIAFSLGRVDSALAWHNDGHMAIARIAWKQMDDAQRIYFSNLLKKHPHYEIFIKVGKPADVPEIEWAFCKAATWADWVRGPRDPGMSQEQSREIAQKFNKPVWHYIDLPFIHPDDTGKFNVEEIRKQMLEPELDEKGEPRHVLAALAYNTKILKDTRAGEADRSVAMTWIMHLVGDLHQPLHATGLVSAANNFVPPQCDRGGNQEAIRVKESDTRAVVLHFYWDALLFANQPGFAGVETMVADLLNDANLKKDKLTELTATNFLDWAEESLAICKSTVFKDGDKFLKFKALPLHSRIDFNDTTIPVLSEAYQKAAATTARRRMVLAGFRLADQFKNAMPTSAN